MEGRFGIRQQPKVNQTKLFVAALAFAAMQVAPSTTDLVQLNGNLHLFYVLASLLISVLLALEVGE